MKSDFRYTNSAETAKPGYLAKKWSRLFPGWNRRPKAKQPEIVQLKRRVA